MKKLFIVLSLVVFTIALTACKKKPEAKSRAVISGAEPALLAVGDTFNPLAGITAEDEKDGDLTSKITQENNVDTSKWGVYTATYKVKNSDKVTTRVDRKVIVGDFANYTAANFRYATADIRHAFFAAAEKYLLDTMTAGIPIQANATYQLFSPRMELRLEDYDPIMGFGIMYSDMKANDDTVIMDNNQFGNANEKTYRQAWGSDITTFQHWLYDDSVSSDLMEYFLDALYSFQFTGEGDEYDLLPSMATGAPIPVIEGDAYEDPFNPDLVLSKKWKVEIKDGLEWTFHEDTPNTASYDKVIDAEDFIWTYKESLDQGWFRAISGGGDFFASTQAIKNAKDYYDDLNDDTVAAGDKTKWEDVGLKQDGDNNALVFEFEDYMSEWTVKYWLASFTMTPIHKELYESLWEGTGENKTNKYGTTPQTTAFHGPYVVDYYEADKTIRLSKNPNFHATEDYNFTNLNISIIEDPQIRFQEFVSGKVDVAGLPTSSYDEYKNDPRLKFVPGATTFRLAINGLGTKEAQKAQFPESDFTPEPLLAKLDFKKAMYFAVDRNKLANDIIKTVTPQMYHFTEAYIVDASTFTPFRTLDLADTVGEDYSPATNGFNASLAKSYWEDAIEEAVEDGSYKKGDRIELTLSIQSGSEAMQLLGDFLKESYETTFVHDELDIKVKINVTPFAFPDNYYAAVLIGAVDLGMGGISGSTLDAASFLEVYCSDNRGGFTMDWGIDTTIPEIEVNYTVDGVERREMWSFDAIVAALNSTVKVVNGMEDTSSTTE